MSIKKKDQEVTLAGNDAEVGVKMITAKNLHNFFLKISYDVVAQLFAANGEVKQEDIDAEIQKVLTKFEVVFSEPKGLPSKRRIEHDTNLKPGTQPLFEKAYIYSHALKDEMEKMVKDMLSQDQIQVSTSPFASPTILVKKKTYLKVLCGL